MYRFGFSGGSRGSHRWFNQRANRSHAASGAGASAGSVDSLLSRVKGFSGPAKAGVTSATLAAAGDVLAQSLVMHLQKDATKVEYDPIRTLRMLGFGLCCYGPLQFYWYNMLDWRFPAKNTANFLTKVTLNQLALAPVTLSTVFSWNLAWTGKAEQIPSKIKNDLLPTMLNGWKFWVPAASINFYCIPVQHQVLYMSCCGMLWTAYLSYACTHAIAPGQPMKAIS